MIKSRIIVTGATGKTGRVVVAEPLNAAYHVRTMVRREDGRSAHAGRLDGETGARPLIFSSARECGAPELQPSPSAPITTDRDGGVIPFDMRCAKTR
jgi:uncharacterized protein YbjT (DUF2867 family)